LTGERIFGRIIGFYFGFRRIKVRGKEKNKA